MNYFDFHHHHINIKNGIYNATWGNIPLENTYSIGIHPMEIPRNWEEILEVIQGIAKSNNCIAIGECGLDARSNTPIELQERILYQQIELANQIDKPIIIHCVRKYAQLIPTIKKAKVPMIVHGFNKNEQLAKELIKHGFLLSFGTEIIRNKTLQNTIKSVSIENIFLETDTKNIDISDVYKTTAQIFEKDEDWVTKKIYQNLKKIKIK